MQHETADSMWGSTQQKAFEDEYMEATFGGMLINHPDPNEVFINDGGFTSSTWNSGSSWTSGSSWNGSTTGTSWNDSTSSWDNGEMSVLAGGTCVPS